MQHIQRSARLAGRLAQWDGGAATGVHSVASRLVAGFDVAHADSDVTLAVEELDAQKSYHLDHMGRGNDDAAIRADVEQLTELVGWLTGPTDTSVHFVSGEVHVYLDVVDAGTPRASAAGRIVVRDRQDRLRVWPFDDLQAPWLASATTQDYMARAAAEAVDAFGFDCSGNRGSGAPPWAAPVEIADLIHDGADHDDTGAVVARAARKGEEP